MPGRPGGPPARAGGPGALCAVILAGGRGSRLGGADKPGIVIGDRPLVTAVAAAAAGAGAKRLVLVGPVRPDMPGWPGLTVEVTREQPPGAGPVPALAAGLRLASESWLLLLAADLPFLRSRHLRLLADTAISAAGGAVLMDDAGRAQWLTSCWPTAALRTAVAGYAGQSLGGLLGPLAPAPVILDPGAGEPPPWLDCDTADDLAEARRLAGGGTR